MYRSRPLFFSGGRTLLTGKRVWPARLVLVSVSILLTGLDYSPERGTVTWVWIVGLDCGTGLE